MEFFSEVMTGIRNPKAHGNQIIIRGDAVRKLNLASLLMHEIDQSIIVTSIQE